ncbi:MAG: SDR family NAD(P)-dependent oxidoreductase [Acidimicrobiales bacterium]
MAISGRDPERLAAAAAELRALGGDVVTIVADLSQPAGGRAFVEQAIAALGGVDILVTNAGGNWRDGR